MAESDFERVFAVLAGAEVRYFVVGGVAVVLHGYLRFTADVDLVVALDRDNVLAALRALASLDYRPRAAVNMEDFGDAALREEWVTEKGLMVFSLWSPLMPATEIDLFVREPVPFEEAWSRVVHADLGGVDVPVASLSDLIALKRNAGRPKDLLDAEELEKIAQRSRSDDGQG